MRGPRVIAVANQKGGVGKTTTSVNLSAALAEAGHPTLLIDLDPQANASLAFGFGREHAALTMYDCLVGDHPLESAVRATPHEGLSFLPASVDLAAAEIELVGSEGRESRLRRSLGEYLRGARAPAFVIIDCPPSLGLLTVNALSAAGELVVPIQAEFYALDGVGQLVHTVSLIRSGLNPGLRISLVCLTMIDPSEVAQCHVSEEVRAYLGNAVARCVIPRDEALSTAPAAGMTALSHAGSSAGARAYRDLATELLERGMGSGTADGPARGDDLVATGQGAGL